MGEKMKPRHERPSPPIKTKTASHGATGRPTAPEKTLPGQPAQSAGPTLADLTPDPEAEARREAARERSRRWREAQKAKLNPEAAAREAAEREAREAAEREAREAAEREISERAAKFNMMLTDGLACGVEVATTLVQAAWFDSTRPRFGRARSQLVAQQWAPILLPYLEKYLGDNPQVVIASLATGALVASWISEYNGDSAVPVAPARPTVVHDATATA